jgi:hypothetical protein
MDGPPRRMASSSSRRAAATTCWEVEQKFVLDDATAVLKRLQDAGLREHGRRHMVDSYFDVAADDYPLIRQDCWLRYRCCTNEGVAATTTSSSDSRATGQWELKRGNRESISSSNADNRSEGASRATVYQELEGWEALQATQELLLGGLPPYPISESSTTQATANTKGLLARDLYEIPPPPVAIPGLQAFARIVTHRSSWSLPRDDDDDVAVVVVDLDTTDFGYAVGEVERLVTKASDIEAARRDLQTWLETVLGEDALAGPPPVGKLEYYLQTQQPHVYNILVEEGLVAS